MPQDVTNHNLTGPESDVLCDPWLATFCRLTQMLSTRWINVIEQQMWYQEAFADAYQNVFGFVSIWSLTKGRKGIGN